jgi:hypothetical protein
LTFQILCCFISNLIAQFSYSGNADWLVVLLPAIDSEQQIGDETTKYLNHEPVFASGNQVVRLDVPLPPDEEGLYVPAKLVNLGNFFSR